MLQHAQQRVLVLQMPSSCFLLTCLLLACPDTIGWTGAGAWTWLDKSPYVASRTIIDAANTSLSCVALVTTCLNTTGSTTSAPINCSSSYVAVSCANDSYGFVCARPTDAAGAHMLLT